ncbi:MAG TPA: ATP-grasp domain-containing protein [Candidatus Methylomirabilis sp.]|nr:ATP-grasp domain-containing protein [Candidatus Methylomirabilis sp.]
MRVCFLLERGSPPRLNPIMAEVFSRLEAFGVKVTVRYPEEELIRLDTLAVQADLYLLKSDTEFALSLAIALEHLGGKVLNPSSACLLAKDKVLAAATLLHAGILPPRSLVAWRPAALAPAVAAEALILKPHRGYHGVGITVAETPEALPEETAYPDLVFAQTYLAHARKDLKIFAIGEEIFGVRKAYSPDSFLRAGAPAPLSPEVEDIARRCGEAFGLGLYGLDIAESEDGPYVIDVNYFPGYRGVPDAARRLAEHILRVARG